MDDRTWQRIGRTSFRQRMLLIAVGAGPVIGGVFLLQIAPAVTGLLLDGVLERYSIVVEVTAGIALYALVLSFGALLHRGLLATKDGSRVRLGRQELPAAALERARLEFETRHGDRRQLILRLEAGRRRARLWLRVDDRVLLDPDEQALLIRVLEHSAVTPPVSVYDPTGRFARVNFPGSLTRADAIALVRDLRDPAARLPITD